MTISTIRETFAARYAHQPLYLQAIGEILDSIESYTEAGEFNDTAYRRVERLLIPERVIVFRVQWDDDAGVTQHNIGYRVQFNSALGPYKGGLRFDPSVREDTFKFLGLEQIFKNALTGLPLGAGKGGSDFDPKGKSDAEIRRFCRAFMVALHRELGIDHDVPAGDIGVGAREIGYMFGMYKEITGRDEGVLTGKNELFGGSCRRTEATGHGVVYMAEAAARMHQLNLTEMTAVVSGSGNVALYAARALLDRGTTVLTVSDRGGYVYKREGFTHADIRGIETQKAYGHSLAQIAITGAEYCEGKPWGVAADAYFPCATQNEMDGGEAAGLAAYAKLLVEGANMPLTAEAVAALQSSAAAYVPGKAANAGGVAVSGLEMAQNASRLPWPCDRVEEELKNIMLRIHDRCVEYGQREDGTIDYVKGANVGGFVRVFSAMEKLGW